MRGRRGASVKFVSIRGDHDAVLWMRVERDDGEAHDGIAARALAVRRLHPARFAHFSKGTNRSVRRVAPGASHDAKRVRASKVFKAASKRTGSTTFS